MNPLIYQLITIDQKNLPIMGAISRLNLSQNGKTDWNKLLKKIKLAYMLLC